MKEIVFSRKVFIFILIATHCFGFIKQLTSPNLFTDDSDDYILLAQNSIEYGIPYSGTILPSQDLSDLPNNSKFTSRPILYSLFIWCTGGLFISLLLTLLIQNILSVFSILLIDRLFKSQGFEINYLLASLCLLFFPSLWIYANWIMSETLFMFLLTALVFSFTLKKYLMSSFLLSLAFLTKPVVVFIIFLWFIGLMIYSIKSKKVKMAFAAIIPLLVLLAQIGVNYKFAKAPIVSSMPAINLVHYNAYFTLSKIDGDEKAKDWVTNLDNYGQQIEEKHGFYESYVYKKEQATQVIKDNFFTYLIIHAQGSMRFFVDPGRFDLLNFFTIYQEMGNDGWTNTFHHSGITGLWQKAKQENLILLIAIGFIFLWNVIRLFFMAKHTRHLLSKPMLGFTILLLILYFAALTGPVSTARFLIPVFPLVLFWVSLRLPKKSS